MSNFNLPQHKRVPFENFDVATFDGAMFFDPNSADDQEAFGQYFELISSFPGIPYYTNIPKNSDDQFAPSDGFVLVLNPMRRRANKEAGEEGLQLASVLVAQLPATETLMADANYTDWCFSTLYSAHLNKLETALRAETQLPVAVAEFTTSGRRAGVDATWKEIGAEIVKALREKGLDISSAKDLRNMLSSTSYATAIAPKVRQEVWENIIGACKKLAAKRGLSVEIFDHWLDTRDQVSRTMEIDDDILEGLEGLVGAE